MNEPGELSPVCIKQDDDGHHYLIPAARVEAFDALLESDADTFDDQFSIYRLYGHPLLLQAVHKLE